MFSAFFIKRPKFAMVVSLFIMLAGLICINKLPIAEYPEVTPPSIMVMANYAGASAQVIADTVAAPIEAEINGIEGLSYYSSTSGNDGSYQLSLTFDPDTDSDIALVNVNNAVKRAEPNLPTEITTTGINVMKRTADFLGIVAFSSSNPEHTPLFLTNYISINVKDAVARVDGVGQASIFGDMNYSMRIWLDPIRMQYYEISQEEIKAAVRAQNVQAATGSVGSEGASDYMQIKVETRGRLQEASEFADIIIRTGEDGRLVRLSDVAKIELGAESYSGLSTLNGNPAAMLAIFKLSDGNAIQITNDTKALLEKMSANFPEGITWTMPYDSSKFVIASMKEIVETLFLTFFLVVLITYVFLQDWRATIVPAVAIPVSLIGTFFFMYILDMSINTLTMFALILVIGSVVDDAICVVECCMRLIQEEKMSPTDAAYRTMRELSGALVATTMVVVAVYTPIAFYGGMVGIIYQQFAITMCIALCLSTVVALTLSPALCALVLRKNSEPRGFFRLFNKGLDATRGFYLGVGGFLARRIVFTIVILGGVLFGNYALYNTLSSSFVPSEDKGSLMCEIILPQGASLSRTEKVIDEVVQIALSIEGVDRVQASPGMSITSGNGENMAMMIVSLKDWDERTTEETSVEAIQLELVKRCSGIPDASVSAFVPPAIMGLGMTGGVSFALQATGNQTSQEISQAANHLIGKIMESGKAMFASTSFDTNTPMINLDIDRDKAEALGVSIGSIFSTLQTQLGSAYVNDFNMYGKTYQVKLQAEASYRENPNAIGRLSVPSADGSVVPIDAIAKIEWTIGPRQIERFNMFPAANIRTQGLPDVDSGTMMNLIEELVQTELSGDYQIAWTDMSYQESQNEGQILTLVLLAVVFAYLFLAAQYESWTTPISVMLSVVTATLGGMGALLLTGRSMDIYCQLGLLMLVGLTAKTAILMVEYAKQQRDEGMSLYESAMTGMKMRFRAVMMTALSFVIGVSPMIVATGAGAGSRLSIGTTTFWGMFVATALGMVLIPGLYVITRTMSETTKRIFGKTFGNTARQKNKIAP